MTDLLLLKSIVVIAASASAVAMLVRMKLPPVLGYLLAGLLIGPNGFGILDENPETRFLAELGVIFLMFTAGMELSLPVVRQAWHHVIVAGSLQVGLTGLAVAAPATLLGLQASTAIILGGAVAMSSTALVLKQLSDQGELTSRHGRLAVGVLLFQDLATLPFIVAINTWQSGEARASWLDLAVPLLIAVGALVCLAFLCRPVFRTILAAVTRTKSAELFLLTVLLLALGVAFGVHLTGLAPPIGAFLAGMVIGGSDFRHQVADDVRPFRDVLVGLFFVTVGMKIEPGVALAAPITVVAVIAAFTLGKALLIVAVAPIMGWPIHLSVRLALVLAHGGEFGLLLLTQAINVGMFGHEVGQVALLGLAVTMALAPIFIQWNCRIADWLTGEQSRSHRRSQEAEAAEASRDVTDHIVLCGCGRVGRLVAVALKAARVPYVALEADHTNFRQAKRRGHNVVFGDATRKGLLEAAGLERARALAITFDQWQAVERIVHLAREINPHAAVIVSAEDERRLTHIPSAAVTVLPENLSAGLELAAQMLLVSGLDRRQVEDTIVKVRTWLKDDRGGRRTEKHLPQGIGAAE